MNTGIVAAIGAFTIWGLLPAYWKLIAAAPALEVLSHRIIWSLLLLLLLLLARRRWHSFRQALADRRTLLTSLGCALLLGVNWLTYIWAVNAGHIVETSLGYYINPLVNVVLAVTLLRERLRPAQWCAIALAGAGVLYLTLDYGRLPWISLTLAFTFGCYGLLRKRAALGTLEGQSLETALLLVPALAFLGYAAAQGNATFGQHDTTLNLLLIGTGVATALPLLLFAYAAKRISLSTLGFLQYIGPTLNLLLGVVVYGESFGEDRLLGFSLIWLALLIYSGEGALQRLRLRPLSPAR